MSSDPDQIRDEINRTQRELSADVDALTEKLSPPRMVERRVQATRDAMTNVKDKIMGSTGQGTPSMSSDSASIGQTITDRTSTARDSAAATVSSAADAARSAPGLVRRQAVGNPLAAGLIAFGAGWLLSSLLPASDPEQQAAIQVKDFATEHGRPVAQQLGEAGQQAAAQLRESAQQRTESVKDTATDAAATVSAEAQSAASHVSSQTQEAASTVREQAGPGN